MKRDVDMLNGPLGRGIIVYTIPIILTGLLQLLFNAADLVIVGQYCGSISVAAVSATGALTNLIITLFIGLSVGTGVSVAHGLGGHHDEDVRRIVHTALPTAVIGGIVLTLFGITFADDFLRLMNTPDNVLPLSAIYMRYYFGGMTFSIVYNFCASILRAAGDTRSPLIFLMISGVINVVLNIFFVTALDMNVAGVALATAISQGISAVLVVIALCRRTDACRLCLRKIRIYKEQLLRIIKIGLPAGIQGSLFSISNVLIQSSLNSFNSDFIMSGNGAAGNLDGFIWVIMNAFHQTAVNFIGQNTGSHNFTRVKKTYTYCIIFVTAFGVISSLIMYAFGEPLLSLYITDSTEAIQYGMVRFRYVLLPYFLCGLLDVSTGAMRGLGDSFKSMLICVLGICGIRVMWIYGIFSIPQYHTLDCLYFSYPVTWIITFTIQTIAFVMLYKKKAAEYKVATNH